MTPAAPDVAEMVAWCEATAHGHDMQAEYERELDRDGASPRSSLAQGYEHSATMLRAIAARLRRGGEHDGG